MASVDLSCPHCGKGNMDVPDEAGQLCWSCNNRLDEPPPETAQPENPLNSCLVCSKPILPLALRETEITEGDFEIMLSVARNKNATSGRYKGKFKRIPYVNPKKQLVYKFHSLSDVKKLEIVTKLSLTADSENLKEIEKQILYFQRAEKNNILDQLWTEVQIHSGLTLDNNPFKKI